MRRELILVFILILLPITGNLVFNAYHELSHQRIYVKTGHVNITTAMFFEFPHIYFMTKADATPHSDRVTARNFNLASEVNGYHTGALIMNLWMMTLLICVFLAYLGGEK